MHYRLALNHKLRNLLHTGLLVGGMALVLALCASLLLGGSAWIGVFIGIVIVMVWLPEVSPSWLLRLYQARPIGLEQSPSIHAAVGELSRRAGLPAVPAVFWVPSHTLNAFAVGHRRRSAIAITEGLLRTLSMRELVAVLAHEISHIRNNDLRLMTLADLISRLTHVLAITGFIMILLALPLVLVGAWNISIGGLLLLVLSPSINALLQLGLSRVREFDADLDAARLTGDPAALAAALRRIDQVQLNPWQRVLLPGYRDRQPSILRSHPVTDERVQRLLRLQHEPLPSKLPDAQATLSPYRGVVIRRPRQRLFTGTWR